MHVSFVSNMAGVTSTEVKEQWFLGFFFIICLLRNNEGTIWTPLTCLTQPHLSACPKLGPRFLLSTDVYRCQMFVKSSSSL